MPINSSSDRYLELPKYVRFGEADTKSQTVAVAAESLARRAVFCCVGVNRSFESCGRGAEKSRPCEDGVGGDARATFQPIDPPLERTDGFMLQVDRRRRSVSRGAFERGVEPEHCAALAVGPHQKMLEKAHQGLVFANRQRDA